MTEESINEHQLKLMIIDDDVEITDCIERAVEDLDLSVCSINDSKLISTTYKDFTPDVIFLDLGLPGFGGMEVVHHLFDLGCKAKVFLISGLDRVSLDSCQAAGMNINLNIVGALTKPFTREDIHYALTV